MFPLLRAAPELESTWIRELELRLLAGVRQDAESFQRQLTLLPLAFVSDVRTQRRHSKAGSVCKFALTQEWPRSS